MSGRKGKSYDTSDPDAVKKAQAEDEDHERDLDYVVASPRGRRWLYNLIFTDCHVATLSFVPGADVQTLAFNEGARAIGEALLDTIRVRQPALYMKMLEENHFDD